MSEKNLESASEKPEESVPEILLAFLDAKTPAEKLEVLETFGIPSEGDRDRIRILYNMAASVDLEAGGQSPDRLYSDLRHHLQIRERYEKPRR